MQRTYYIEENLNPKWDDQSFVFDLPGDINSEPANGCELWEFTICSVMWFDRLIRVRLFDFDALGSNAFLGQTTVCLTDIVIASLERNLGGDTARPGRWI